MKSGMFPFRDVGPVCRLVLCSRYYWGVDRAS